MKKPLIISLVVIVLAVVFFVVNPFAVFGATTNTHSTSQTSAVAATESGSTTPTPSTDESHPKEDTGVIGLFGINWKLFVAQLVNFAIVLFVLWKFVFKPVTSTMEARTKKIEDSLNDADRITKEKTEFEQWKNAEMVKARTEATMVINEAKQTAEKVKQETIEATRLEQQQVLEKAKQELLAAQKQTIAEAKSSIADMVISSTEKLLKVKIDSKTDSKLIKDSMAELGDQS